MTDRIPRRPIPGGIPRDAVTVAVGPIGIFLGLPEGCAGVELDPRDAIVLADGLRQAVRAYQARAMLGPGGEA